MCFACQNALVEALARKRAMTGWVCPRCGASNAPTIVTCACKPPPHPSEYEPLRDENTAAPLVMNP